MVFVRPSNAFIVQMDNGKSFAFSHYKDGKDRKIALLFGKYTDGTKSIFKVVKVKKFSAVIEKKHVDLNNTDTIMQVLDPYKGSIKKISEDINGL